MGNSCSYRGSQEGTYRCVYLPFLTRSYCAPPASWARYSHLLHFLTEHHSSSQKEVPSSSSSLYGEDRGLERPPAKGSCSPFTLSHANSPFAGILLIPCPVTAVPSRVSRFFTPCQESSLVCWPGLPRLWDQHSDTPSSQEFVDLNQQPELLTPQHPDKMNTALLWCLQGMEVEMLCEERV